MTKETFYFRGFNISGDNRYVLLKQSVEKEAQRYLLSPRATYHTSSDSVYRQYVSQKGDDIRRKSILLIPSSSEHFDPQEIYAPQPSTKLTVQFDMLGRTIIQINER